MGQMYSRTGDRRSIKLRYITDRQRGPVQFSRSVVSDSEILNCRWTDTQM